MHEHFFLAALLSLAAVTIGCQEGDGTPIDCEGDHQIETTSDLEAIATCESVSGNLTFTELSGGPILELPYLTTVGGLYIWNNDSLTDIDIPAVTSVNDQLFVDGNGALANIDMPSLTSVGSYLQIRDNLNLANLDMSALTAVGNELSLSNNDAMTSLSRLSNLTSIEGSLRIRNNYCLSQTEAEAFAAEITISGTMMVSDNGTGYPCE